MKGIIFSKKCYPLALIFLATVIIHFFSQPAISFFLPWTNFQNPAYLDPFGNYMFPFRTIPPMGNNPWTGSTSSPLPFFNTLYQPSLLTWYGNQFVPSGLPYNRSDLGIPLPSPFLQWPTAANNFIPNYIPETGSILYGSNLYGPNLMTGSLMSPGINSWWPFMPTSGARGAMSYSPNPTPPAPVGIESTQFQYKPAAFQSIGLTYVPDQPSYVNGQVLVTFRPGVPIAEMTRVYATHQCRELYTSPYAGFKILALPSFLTVLEAARRLSLEPSVLYASPNFYRHAHLIPNDPYYRYQWHLTRLNCGYAWDFSTGLGAKVGLLDSGVAYQTAGVYAKAPDLAGTIIVPGYDFINLDAFPDDDYGHGTHMAGCIAQTTNNLLGVAGVAFASTIMPVKVMNNLGNTPISTEVDGIYYATNNGVKIINMSLGGAGTDATEQAAVTYAYNSGVTVICSAGNSSSNIPEYPASYPECVSVSAIRYDNTKPAYSNYGASIDVCAPGGDLSVDQNLDGFGDGILQQTHNGTNFTTFYYYFMEGTSPACALVSGVAALIVSKSSVPLTSLQVTNTLTGTATDLGVLGWDQYYGYGLVNAYLAVVRTL